MNNPLKYIDPDGEAATLAIGTLAGGSTTTGGAVVATGAAPLIVAGAAGIGLGYAVNQIPGVSEHLLIPGFAEALSDLLVGASQMSDNRHNTKVAEGLIAAAAIELGKIGAAGGPEKDPDFRHHQKEIKAMLDRARRIAERLPKKAQEKLMEQIERLRHGAAIQ
jgi:hypothetical protein